MLDVFVSTFPWFWSTSLPEGNVARHPHGNLLAQEWRRRREAPATALRADLSQRVPPNHLMFNGIFGCKPTILVYLHVWKHMEIPHKWGIKHCFSPWFSGRCVFWIDAAARAGCWGRTPSKTARSWRKSAAWNLKCARERLGVAKEALGAVDWKKMEGWQTVQVYGGCFLFDFVVSTFCSFKRSTVRLW